MLKEELAAMANSKTQNPKPNQIANPKLQIFWNLDNLDIGIYLEFEVWALGFI